MDAQGTLRAVAGHIPLARSSTFGRAKPCRDAALKWLLVSIIVVFTIRKFPCRSSCLRENLSLPVFTGTVMSSDDLHSSNGRPEIVDIELDVRLLGSLVEESEDIPADDSELLARLDTAVTMAGGVEARLDEILGQLDDLLTSLEIKDSDEPQQVTIPRSESQSERPPSEQ